MKSARVIIRGIRDGLGGKETLEFSDVVIQCVPIFPMPYFNMLRVKTSYGGTVHKIPEG